MAAQPTPPGHYPPQGQQPGYPGGQSGYPRAPSAVGFGPPQQGYGPPPLGYQQGAPPQVYGPQPGGPPPPVAAAPPGANWKVPDDDPEFDEKRMPSAPPPPDMSRLPTFTGFHVGTPGHMAPLPAPALPPPPTQPPAHAQFERCAELREEECREALVEHVSQFCCYGKKPAKRMQMTKFLASTALRYQLETFCEARSTSYEHVAFVNQPIDGPQNGPPPSPWDIFVAPTMEFKTHVKTVEIPHTASVMCCHGCGGGGFNQCHHCYGRGRTRCNSCSGRGHNRTHRNGDWVNEPCTWCHGSGRRRCLTCGGDGRVTCHTCEGRCQLKWFVQLTVNFTNHEDDFILENTDLPDHLVRQVESNVVVKETMFYCWPLTDYPVAEIGRSSAALIEKHKVAFNTEKRLNQRQSLLAIPVTEIHYKWKEKERRYWVYGLDKKVYITDYPATCCCGCNIL